jgi:glycosyltransferase involved in cell wall biosynthesis
MAIRLCILSEDFYPAMHGSTTQLLLLGRELSARGSQVMVVTRQLQKEHPRKERIEGCDVYRVPPAWGMSRWGKYVMLVPALWTLMTYRSQYDVVLVSNLAVTGILGVLVAKLFAKKCILRASSCGELDGSYAYALDDRPDRFKRFVVTILAGIRNLIIKRADCFLSITTPITEELLRENIPKDRIAIFANGVESDRFCPVPEAEKKGLRKKLSIPERFVYVYTGRLAAGKGLPTLLAAFKRIVSTRSDLHLFLVGSGQGYALGRDDELQSFVLQHGLDSRVTFTGNVSNVDEYLKASDCFVFPTEYEALSNSAIEAISCGLPCVATQVGGVPDIIEDGVNGILVPARDADALAEAMLKIVQDPVARQKFSLASRTIAKEKFSLEARVIAFESLCDDLLAL